MNKLSEQSDRIRNAFDSVEEKKDQPAMFSEPDLNDEDKRLGAEAAALADAPPAWVASPAIWKEARKEVIPYAEKYKEPYAVVAHVYKQKGGTVK